MTSSRCRSGLTAPEVLVVFAVLAVLAALGLPAVAQARRSADRLRCGDNLRRVGAALSGYHDACDSFPPGTDTEPYRDLSWMGRTLPFTRNSVLWPQVRSAYRVTPRPWQVPPHVGHYALPLYACPADARMRSAKAEVTVNSMTAGGEAVSERLRVGLTSYLGASGTDLHSRDGVLYAGSAVRRGDIADGPGQTLLVGERPPDGELEYGWWYAGPGQQRTGSADVVLGAREINVVRPGECPPGPYGFGPDKVNDPCAVFHFWSLHGGGANFLMADGSLRWLSYAAAGVLPALATRAGGEDVRPDD